MRIEEEMRANYTDTPNGQEQKPTVVLLLYLFIRRRYTRKSVWERIPSANQSCIQGKIFVRGDSKVFRFQNGKSESLFLQRKNPRRIAWTVLFRRQHRKGISEVRPIERRVLGGGREAQETNPYHRRSRRSARAGR